MKSPLLVWMAAAGLMAQIRPLPFDTDLKAHLALTDDQVTRIRANNAEATSRAQADMMRTFQLQREIAAELAKPSPDPMVVGSRYAEIETMCRAGLQAHGRARTQNLAVLSDAQKAKLKALEEAARMSAVVSEARSANLYRSNSLSLADLLLGGFPGSTLLAPYVPIGDTPQARRCSDGFSNFGLPFLPGGVLP